MKGQTESDPDQIARLKVQCFAMSQQIGNLQQRLERLERQLGASASTQASSPPSKPERIETSTPTKSLDEVIEEQPSLEEALRGSLGFMTEQEAVGAKPGGTPSAMPESLSWEMRLALRWLPLIGGVLLIAGAAFAAPLIQAHLTPAMKITIGYVVAVLVYGCGWIVQPHAEQLGRVVRAIALALAYFVSFAMHWIPAVSVVSAPTSLTLMLLCAAGMIIMAELWRSELTASVAFALGILAALISAPTSQEFALIAIGVLALGAGAMLVRHEWRHLTALALAGTYVATVVVWLLTPVGKSVGEISAHLGALVAYHAIFTAAFWRWGRVWVARERLAQESEIGLEMPGSASGLLPYSTAFAMLNSLGLSALTLLLLWRTKTLWPHVHWFLFALAGAEAARLGVAGLRRGDLRVFHSLTAFALGTAGLVSLTSGLTESTVLAAEALILAFAASRAPVLRLLRPLTVVCAFLAVRPFDVRGAIGLPGLVSTLSPGALLLASTLPWEAIWTKRDRPFASGWLAEVDFFSGQIRSVIAAGMVTGALLSYVSNNRMGVTVSLGTLTVALMLGMVLLRAVAWSTAALLTTLITLLDLALHPPLTNEVVLFGCLWIAIAVYLWQEVGRRATTLRGVRGVDLAHVLFTLGAMLFALKATEDLHPKRGLILAAFVPVLGALGVIGLRLPMLPSLVRLPEERDRETRTTLLVSWSSLTLGHLIAAALGVAALVIATFMDSSGSLIPAAVIAVALLFGWAWIHRGSTTESPAEWILLATALGSISVAVLIFAELAPWSGLVVAGLCGGMLFLGLASRSFPATTLALLGMIASPAPGFIAGLIHRLDKFDFLCGLGTGALLTIAALLRHRVRAEFHDRPTENFHVLTGMRCAIWLVTGGTLIVLLHLAKGALVTQIFITVSWGVVGFALLLTGFLLRDWPLRLVALGTFALALGRIVLIDLTGFSPLTRAIALFGVGLLLVVAAVAYGLWRARIADASPANSSA